MKLVRNRLTRDTGRYTEGCYIGRAVAAVVPIHTIRTVTFRSNVLYCVAVTVRARSSHGQAKDLSLTVSGPSGYREQTVRALNCKPGLADASEVGECRQSATERVT